MFTHCKNTFVGILIAVILAPSLLLGVTPPKQAEAQMVEGIIGGIVGAGVTYALCESKSTLSDFFESLLGGVLGSIFGGKAGNVQGIASAVFSVPVNETNIGLRNNAEATARATENELYKECILDPVAWVLKSILVAMITQAMLDWVKTGFEGDSPMFERDPLDFVKELASETLNTFLNESGVADELCSPFSSNVVDMVRISATRSTYGAISESSCSLDDALGGNGVAGYEQMVYDGSIEGLGITGAMALVEQGNNPYSAFFTLQAEAASRVDQIVSKEMTILSYGDGVHSQRCTTENGVFGICTPGEIVARQLDDWLGGSLGELEVADEVGEILEAAISWLVHSIFTDGTTDGLLEGSRIAESEAHPYDGNGYKSSDNITEASNGEAVLGQWTSPESGSTYQLTHTGSWVDTETGEVYSPNEGGGDSMARGDAGWSSATGGSFEGEDVDVADLLGGFTIDPATVEAIENIAPTALGYADLAQRTGLVSLGVLGPAVAVGAALTAIATGAYTELAQNLDKAIGKVTGKNYGFFGNVEETTREAIKSAYETVKEFTVDVLGKLGVEVAEQEPEPSIGDWNDPDDPSQGGTVDPGTAGTGDGPGAGQNDNDPNGDGSDPDGGQSDAGGDFGCFLAGTEILMSDGSTKPIETVTVGESVYTYDEHTDAYVSKKVLDVYVHDHDGSYLVINNTLNVTPNHITYINKAWNRIDSATVGDMLFGQYHESVPIETIEVHDTSEQVYNLEIEDVHTYMAEGFLVHNIK